MNVLSPDTTQEEGTTRRGLLKWAVGCLTAAVAAVCGWPLVASLIGPMYRKTGMRYVDVGPLDAIPLDQPTKLTYQEGVESAYIYQMREREVWVVRPSPTEVMVLSPVCTHLSCRIGWFPQSRRFVCPCHGSVFSLTGQVLAGPAPRPLDTLAHKIENGNLWVRWEEFKPGATTKVLV